MTHISGTLYTPAGATLEAGTLTVTLMQDIVTAGGIKVAPVPIVIELATSHGVVDLTVYPTVGSSPAGVTYLAIYDPDVTDTSRPVSQKAGFWTNYWAVPDTADVTLGSFPVPLRNSTVSASDTRFSAIEARLAALEV